MSDPYIKCDRCVLIVAKSKMDYHKQSGECFLKNISDLSGRDQ
jgi:hypothetical protein